MHASLSMQQQTNFFVVYLTSVRCADSQLVLRLHFPHLYLCTYIYLQCVKLTVATSPMATENYPLATYFVLPGAILGDQLP